MTTPGALKHRVTHVSKSHSSTDSSGVVTDNTTEADIWADIQPRRERAQREGGQFVAEVRYHVWYRTDSASVSPDDEIKYDGRTFRVLSVTDIEEEGRYSRAVCEERQ